LENSKNLYDVIDTALKIGLGGIIGWVSSYTVSKLRYDKEKEKYILDKKIATYELAIDKLENYFDKLNKVFSYLSKIRKTTNSNKAIIGISKDDAIILEQRNRDLVESKTDKRVAITRLKLLGAENIINVLEKTETLENDLHNIVYKEFNIETFNSLRAKEKQLINKARDEMAKFYQEMIK